MDRFHRILCGEVHNTVTEEANGHRKLLAEQHVYWREQGRHERERRAQRVELARLVHSNLVTA